MAAGKSDMERIGLFSEVGYTTIGDRYPKVDPSSRPFNGAAYKGKHMLPGGSKTRSALQAGYFDNQFKRIMEKEAYSDPVKSRRQQRMKESARNIGKAFVPNSGEKVSSGAGSNFGTFSGPITTFSPATRARKAYTAPRRNFTTNPPKKGTGYGYVGVTLGKYEEYTPEGYDRAKEMRRKEMQAHKAMLKGAAFKLNHHSQTYFDQNPFRADRPLGPPKKAQTKLPNIKPFKPSSPPKKIGGSKAGTFHPYPTHSNDPYSTKAKRLPITNKEGKIFQPTPGSKSRPTNSIISQNIARSVHRDNYKTVRQVMAF